MSGLSASLPARQGRAGESDPSPLDAPSAMARVPRNTGFRGKRISRGATDCMDPTRAARIRDGAVWRRADFRGGTFELWTFELWTFDAQAFDVWTHAEAISRELNEASFCSSCPLARGLPARPRSVADSVQHPVLRRTSRISRRTLDLRCPDFRCSGFRHAKVRSASDQRRRIR